MRWIPARCRSARAEADGLGRWRPLSGPLRLSWPVQPRAAAAPSNRAWVDPDRSATALASAAPAAEPARKRSYTRNAGAEANAAAEPAAVHSHIAAAREPLDRPEPATTGAIAAAPHDEARPAERPSSAGAPRSGQAGEAPELAPSPAPMGAGRIRAAPGQESFRRRTRRRRQARSGADRVERPRAAPRITGGGREYPAPSGPGRSRPHGLSASASITLSVSRRVGERR